MATHASILEDCLKRKKVKLPADLKRIIISAAKDETTDNSPREMAKALHVVVSALRTENQANIKALSEAVTKQEPVEEVKKQDETPAKSNVRAEETSQENAPAQVAKVSPEPELQQERGKQDSAGVEEAVESDPFTSSLQDYVQSLPEKSQAKWTPEVLAAAQEYHSTGNKAVLDKLTPIQRGNVERISELVKGTSTEAEAETKARKEAAEDRKFDKATTDPTYEKVLFKLEDKLVRATRIVKTGVNRNAVNRAVRDLKKLIGLNIADVVIVSPSDIMGLKVNQTQKQLQAIFNAKAQGFYLGGKTYIVPEWIQVERGYTDYQAVAALILHEHVIHGGIESIKEAFPEAYKKWQNLASQIPASELDALAKLYTDYKDWETSPRSMDGITQEWLAIKWEKMGLDKLRIRGNGTLIDKFTIWLQDLYKQAVGIADNDPLTETQMDKAIQSLAEDLIMSRKGGAATGISSGRIQLSRPAAYQKKTDELIKEYEGKSETPTNVEAFSKLYLYSRGLRGEEGSYEILFESGGVVVVDSGATGATTLRIDPRALSISLAGESDPWGKLAITLDEEIIHLAQALAIKDKWKNSDSELTLSEFTLQGSEDILNEIAQVTANGPESTRQRVDLAARTTMESYFKIKASGLSDALSKLDNTPLERNKFMAEFTRQIIQADADNQVVESVWQKVVGMAKSTWADLIDNFKQVRTIFKSGDAGLLIQAYINDTEAKLASFKPTDNARLSLPKPVSAPEPTGNPKEDAYTALGYDKTLSSVGSKAVIADIRNATEGSESARQKVQTISNFAKEYLSGGEMNDDGSIPVTEENTARISSIIQNIYTNPDAGQDYTDVFNDAYPDHGGGAATVALQMEALKYAVNLMNTVPTTPLVKGGKAYKAAKAKLELAMSMSASALANDIVLNDYFTVSNAGRALQARGASMKDSSFWTIVKKHQELLENFSKKGPAVEQYKALQALRAETNTKVVVDATEALLGSVNVVSEGLSKADTSEAEAINVENQRKGWIERALEIVGVRERGILREVFDDINEILAMEEAKEVIEARKASAARYSLGNKAAPSSDYSSMSLEELTKAIDEKRSKIGKALKQLKSDQSAPTTKSEAEKLLTQLKAKSKTAKKLPTELKKTFTDQIEKSDLTSEQFLDKMKELGATPTEATALLDESVRLRAKNEKVLAEKAKAKADKDVKSKFDSKSFLSGIIAQMVSAPVESQNNSDWIKLMIINQFMTKGFTEEKARAAAEFMEPFVQKRWSDAQVKALEDSAKILKIKRRSLDKMREAYRAGLFNPNDPIAAALASASGAVPLSLDDYQQLAFHDKKAFESKYFTREADYHMGKMKEILNKTKAPAGWFNILTSSYLSSALSGLTTLNLNYTMPAFNAAVKVGTDSAQLLADITSGKIDFDQGLQAIASNFSNVLEAAEMMAEEAKYALKNDVYSSLSHQNHLSEISGTKTEFNRAIKALREAKANNDKAAYARAMIKLTFTSTDIVRRVLSTADHTWSSYMSDYVMKSEVTRELLSRGKTMEQITALFTASVEAGQEKLDSAKEGGIKFQTSERLALRDASRNALLEALASEFDPDLAKEIADTIDAEGLISTGNNDSEKGGKWDVVHQVMEMAKRIGQGARAQDNELLGRIMTGFITVPANMFNRAAYYTPYGFLRTSVFKEKGLYDQTMRTKAQERMRFVEASVGTTGLMMMAALMALWKDDKDEPIISVTGMGPQDKARNDAWKKSGHQILSLEFKVGGKIISLKAPEVLALPMAFLGAMSDMKVNGKSKSMLEGQWWGEYLAMATIALAKRASFTSPKNPLSAAMGPRASVESVTKGMLWSASSIIPFSGLMKSGGKLFSGDLDQTHMKGALYVNLPIAGPLLGQPALNVLGDRVGANSDDMISFASNRLYQAGIPIYYGSTETKNKNIYDLMATRGVTPSIPSRAALETKYGLLSDEQWRGYVKGRGRLLVEAINDKMEKLQTLPITEADELMDDIAKKATAKAKKAMIDKYGLEDLDSKK